MPEDPGPVPTPRYQRILRAADDLAAGLGHAYVGVEHLFLAIIADRHAVPRQVLARRADLEQLDAEIRAVLASPEYRGEA